MKGPCFALAITAALGLAGCRNGQNLDPIKITTAQTATRSSACMSLNNFFLANIARESSISLGVGTAAGAVSKAEIVRYERLTDDESKRQMALAAVACELFQSGKLGTGDAAIERYQTLLDQGINAGMRAQALNGDAANFLEDFKKALAASASQATTNKEQFEKLAARMEQTVVKESEKLPKIERDAAAARQNAEAARDYAMEILKTDGGALQQLTALEATVGTMRDRIDYRFTQIDSTLTKFKAKWGITDADLPRCDRDDGRMPYYFAVNRRVLNARWASALSIRTANFVKDNPGCHISAKVEAFTDRSGDANYNSALSLSRAHHAADLLRARGITVIEELGGGVADEEVSSGARVVYVTLQLAPMLAAKPAAAALTTASAATSR